MSAGDDPTRLARRLGFFDAVVIGLGSMIGAGVFAAFSPAASAAGSGLLLGLMIAAGLAYCNATSSASLAARYPMSGGTYVYGRERLGRFWGFLAGWAFVAGKTASCAAMATTFAAHVAPRVSGPVAAGVTLAITAVNYRGVRKTAVLTRVLLALVLATLVIAVAAALGGGAASTARIGPLGTGGTGGTLRSAGILFFAFAGYARIATLGEEVVNPRRTIPRAIPAALGITVAVYAVAATAALLALGPEGVAATDAPLVAAANSGDFRAVSPVVRAGGAIAALGVLLSLLAGVGRTAFAMAANGELPRVLDAVHRRHHVPHRAELAVGGAVAVAALFVDLRASIAFSSFAVLTYYAIANASAWTLTDSSRVARYLAAAGLVGCVVVAFTLPVPSVVAGAAVLALGAAAWLIAKPGS